MNKHVHPTHHSLQLKMKSFVCAVACLAVFSSKVHAHHGTEYEFDCGMYGGGSIKIKNNGHMGFEVDLEHLDDIIDNSGDTLGYHLHTTWINAASSSRTECGANFTGGHYDPTFKCGPASEAKDAPQCLSANAYDCSHTSPNKCERGDLSGKYGALVVENDFTATKTESRDLQGATTQDFVEDNATRDPMVWSSIVFHDLAKEGERVLCCQIVVEEESMSGSRD